MTSQTFTSVNVSSENLSVLHDFSDGFSDVVDVLGGHTSHTHATILRQIDMVLFDHADHLSFSEPSVAEHTDLVGDVAPVRLLHVVLLLDGFDGVTEARSHGDNTVSHTLALAVPLLLQRRVRQNGGNDERTVDWRVRVHWTNQDLQLGLHALGFFFILGDDTQSADTFAVQTEVLSVRLGQDDLVSFLDELSTIASVPHM